MKNNLKDFLWKGIIEDLPEDFIAFFFPELVELIDYSKGFQFLDKELDALYPDGNNHDRRADKLIQVHLKDGEVNWLLIHVEVQGYDDHSFPKRMFQMCFRIYDKYGIMPYPLVIYTNTNSKFQKDSYQYNNSALELKYRFKTFVLKNHSPSELAEINNPFAIVLEAAWVGLLNKKPGDLELFKIKREIVQKMFRKKYNRQKIEGILNFIKFYVGFEQKEYFNKFEQAIRKENRKSMGVKESIIYYFKEQGKAEGKAEGDEERIRIAIRNMKNRNVEQEDIAAFLGITIEKVKEVLNALQIEAKE